MNVDWIKTLSVFIKRLETVNSFRKRQRERERTKPQASSFSDMFRLAEQEAKQWQPSQPSVDYLSASLSAPLPASLSVSLSSCPPVCLTVSLSICLHVCPVAPTNILIYKRCAVPPVAHSLLQTPSLRFEGIQATSRRVEDDNADSDHKLCRRRRRRLSWSSGRKISQCDKQHFLLRAFKRAKPKPYKSLHILNSVRDICMYNRSELHFDPNWCA